MANDPLSKVEVPRWFDRVAFFWRGACFGFWVCFLVVHWWSGVMVMDPLLFVMVVPAVGLLWALPSVPKAWIAHRNRMRAVRDRTFVREMERWRESEQ